ncbi:ADP compounds hydrolase NudE [Psittacicella melopsittaci]|uniref:ADP compounds hydrolase NudE n=1 Tax=Psittacicella melopsittaci TaxID=2028576 RepID=A0A3A1Y1W4_9GAMM|nr:ADP compounds hydrolase NudE [Psittacicella melopsittaci]RIY31276.1 ADP compounds hydrolase NudE [Psittacicella melopsittaci]
MTEQKRKLPQVSNIQNLGRLGIFNVQSLDIKFNNGQERKYYRLHAAHDAVTVIAVDQDHLLLIEEYSAGTLNYELGFVRGGIDDNEQLLVAAARELGEEVGYKAQLLTHLTSFYNSTGYQTAQMHVVVATGLTPLAQMLEGDEPEPLTIVRWPLAELDTLIAQGLFRDSRNLVALYAFRDYYNSGKLQPALTNSVEL